MAQCLVNVPITYVTKVQFLLIIISPSEPGMIPVPSARSPLGTQQIRLYIYILPKDIIIIIPSVHVVIDRYVTYNNNGSMKEIHFIRNLRILAAQQTVPKYITMKEFLRNISPMK